MGAAGSVIPDRLSEHDCKQLAGDQFNPVVFAALAENGTVSKEAFLAIAANPLEKELINVFVAFCPSKEMDSRTFIKFCRDNKVLHKGDFDSNAADLLFQKAKAQNSITGKAVNYNILRFYMLPLIAEKKNTTVEKLVNKLAKCEGPTLNNATATDAVRFHDDQSTYTGTHTNVSHTPAATTNGNEEEDEKLKAIKKIQNASRAKVAKVELERKIELAKETNNESIAIDAPKEGEHEDKCKIVFNMFCSSTNGEMDSKTFIKLCKDTKLISKTFTAGDADLVFQKAKVRASGPATTGSYSSGVIHGKRVNYEVFRAIAVPCIAEKKGVSTDDVVFAIAKSEGPSLNNATSADAVRFHDDKSTFTGQHKDK